MELDQTLVLTMSVDAGWHLLAGFLLASTPLAGLSVVLFRTGRRRVWPYAPWLLAAVFGAASLIGFPAIPGTAMNSPYLFLVTLASGWSNGVFVSMSVTIVWLAIFGVRPKAGPLSAAEQIP